MVSDGFFDVWTPAKGFRDGTEVDSHSHSNSDVTYNASTSFENEVTDYINELIEEDEFNSVAGK
jgi:hypothetical protein